MDLIADFTIDNQGNIDIFVYDNYTDEQIRKFINRLVEEKKRIPEDTEGMIEMDENEILISFDEEGDDIILNRNEYSF